jgi:hypothetical protein
MRKQEPATTPNPGPLLVNLGPSNPGVGVLPEQTKRHAVPAHEEPQPLLKGKVNIGPSRAGQGNIPDTTHSHKVPGRVEQLARGQGTGMLTANTGDGQDERWSPASENVHRSWKRKGKYDISLPVPSIDPEKQ